MQSGGQLLFQKKQELRQKKSQVKNEKFEDTSQISDSINKSTDYHPLKTHAGDFSTKKVAENIDTSKSEAKKIVDEGQKEAIKELVKEGQKSQLELEELKASSIPLFVACSVFPFEIFPDQIIIDISKITVVHKQFYFTKWEQSILIENVADVSIQITPFFSALTINDKFFAENTMTIKYLKTREAEKAKRIIQGLIAMNKQKIEYSKLNREQILEEVEKIGVALEHK